MQPSSLLCAGASFSAGRNPITFAALDADLNIIILEKWDISAVLSYLQEYKSIWFVISRFTSKTPQSAYLDLKRQVDEAGFQSAFGEENPKHLFETNVRDCYRAWIGQNPLSGRSLEARLQRALILYEQGLRIDDPMEIFEEITRYKLIRGIFRLENIYSTRELDALAAAYLAWLSANQPARVVATGEFILPAQE